MVPRGGFEPPRPCGLRILSPLRLPLTHSYTISYTLIIANCVSLCVNHAAFSLFHISSFGVMFPTSRAERGKIAFVVRLRGSIQCPCPGSFPAWESRLSHVAAASGRAYGRSGAKHHARAPSRASHGYL